MCLKMVMLKQVPVSMMTCLLISDLIYQRYMNLQQASYTSHILFCCPINCLAMSHKMLRVLGRLRWKGCVMV